MQLSGWGRYPKKICQVSRPEKMAEAGQLFGSCKGNAIARGAGKSYGDAALAGGVVLNERLNRFIDFDPKLGNVRVQSGVTLDAIYEVILPKGWMLSVTPGTRFVTVGGCIASNVHGKNQFRKGDFGEYVEELVLVQPDGTEKRCSAKRHSKLFWATIGGMGMTGFILEATLKLMPIRTLTMKTESKRFSNIFECVQLFKEAQADCDYMVAWLDHYGKRTRIGRGIFTKANHEINKNNGVVCKNYKVSKTCLGWISSLIPSFMLNILSSFIFNMIRYRGAAKRWMAKHLSLIDFFHPLDGLKNWNRLYGRNGLLQFHCVLPDNPKVAEDLGCILHFLHKKECYAYLAVLKYHRKHKSQLGFSLDGFSLALDFPNTKIHRKILAALADFVAHLEGRIYLAKDALLTPDQFALMYKDELPRWRTTLHKADPDNVIESAMSKRLNFRGAKQT